MKELKGISVVIPNFNGRLLLPEILPPLYIALDNTGLLFEVIISDDNSTDESISYIKENFPKIIIVQNKINKGFSPTINKGIFLAKYDLLLLLNSDVKLTNSYLKNILTYFDNEDTFGVMGRIIGWDNNEIQDGGKYPSYHGTKIKTSGNFIPLNNSENEKFYSFYLSGANALVSKEKIITLGGFNEIFAPFYIEDVELSLRAWRMGWKCYYEHNAICEHKTSVTIKTKESAKFVKTIYSRNKMYLHSIHLQGYNLTLWYLQLIPELLLNVFMGRFWYIKSLKMFFTSKKEVEESKTNFLKTSKNNLISVNEVVNKILNPLKNKSLKRF